MNSTKSERLFNISVFRLTKPYSKYSASGPNVHNIRIFLLFMTFLKIKLIYYTYVEVKWIGIADNIIIIH